MLLIFNQSGEADPKVEKISGIETYNVKFIVRFPEGQKEVEREGDEEVMSLSNFTFSIQILIAQKD